MATQTITSSSAPVAISRAPSHPSDVELQDLSDLLGLEKAAGRERQIDEVDVAPPHAVKARELWHTPRSNIWKTLATFFSFIVMGANDAVYGVLIPNLEMYYDISYTVVSLIFLSPVVGYVAASVLNNLIHKKLGQRGAALLGPGFHLLAYSVICVHPPFPALVVAFISAGFGNGVLDAAWNAWIGNMANANEVLGFLHGFYGLGATLSPLIATAMITKASFEWYSFYYLMIGGASLELIICAAAFWKENGIKFRAENPEPLDRRTGRTREALSKRVTWVSAVFLLIYAGIEVAMGGWIVTFMIRVRDGDKFSSGISATGFWLGLTLGRISLGFVTPRIGEKLSIALYILAGMALELVVWLVPSFVVNAIAVAFLGFFLGPLFPAAVVAMTKILPQHLHVGAIGFAAAFAGGGACILPFAVGAIAQGAGVQVLQPIIFSMLVLALGLWTIGMPKMNSESDGERKGHEFSAPARWIAQRMPLRTAAA